MATLSPLPWQFFDDNGKPLDGALLYSYEAGTTTPKPTYVDSAGYYANENPMVFDSAGRGIVWLGDGVYKFILRDKHGNQIGTTVDNVRGIDKLASVNSIVELRRLRAGVSSVVYLSGYYSVADGGGGWFYWDSKSTEDDNSGAIIEPNYVGLSGRWIRFIENNQVNPRWFGAKGDGSTDDTASFIIADDFAVDNGYDIVCNAGDYNFVSNPDMQSKVIMEPNAIFRINNVDISLYPIIEQNDNTRHFYKAGTGNITFNSIINVNACWFGAVRDASSIALACKSIASIGGVVKLTVGTFTIGTTGFDFLNVPIEVLPGCHMVISTGCAPINLNIYGNPNYKIIDCAQSDAPILANYCVSPIWFSTIRDGNAIETACKSVIDGGVVRLTNGTFALNTSGLDFHGVPIDVTPGCHMVISTGCAPSNLHIYGEPQYQVISCELADTPVLVRSKVNPVMFGASVHLSEADNTVAVNKCIASAASQMITIPVGINYNRVSVDYKKAIVLDIEKSALYAGETVISGVPDEGGIKTHTSLVPLVLQKNGGPLRICSSDHPNPVYNSDHDVLLQMRNSLPFPVPYFRPEKSSKPIALDISPNGTPDDWSHNIGNSWIDICSTDILSDEMEANGTYESLRLGKFKDGPCQINSAKGGDGVIRHIAMQMDGGGVAIGPNSKNITSGYTLDCHGAQRVDGVQNVTGHVTYGKLSYLEDLRLWAVEATVDMAGLTQLSIQDFPIGCIIVSVAINIESMLIAGGTTASIGIGIDSTPSKYGKTNNMIKNSKSNLMFAFTPLSALEAVRLYAVTSTGNLGNTAFSAGSVRYRIHYYTCEPLSDAP